MSRHRTAACATGRDVSAGGVGFSPFSAITEALLARCLGGRCEPIGEDFQGSSRQVLAGADEVPGLSDAMAADGVGLAAIA